MQAEKEQQTVKEATKEPPPPPEASPPPIDFSTAQIPIPDPEPMPSEAKAQSETDAPEAKAPEAARQSKQERAQMCALVGQALNVYFEESAKYQQSQGLTPLPESVRSLAVAAAERVADKYLPDDLGGDAADEMTVASIVGMDLYRLWKAKRKAQLSDGVLEVRGTVKPEEPKTKPAEQKPQPPPVSERGFYV